MTFDGTAVQTSSADLVAGGKDGPLVDVGFDVEAATGGAAVDAGRARREAGEQLETSRRAT